MGNKESSEDRAASFFGYALAIASAGVVLGAMGICFYDSYARRESYMARIDLMRTERQLRLEEIGLSVLN